MGSYCECALYWYQLLNCEQIYDMLFVLEIISPLGALLSYQCGGTGQGVGSFTTARRKKVSGGCLSGCLLQIC